MNTTKTTEQLEEIVDLLEYDYITYVSDRRVRMVVAGGRFIVSLTVDDPEGDSVEMVAFENTQAELIFTEARFNHAFPNTVATFVNMYLAA